MRARRRLGATFEKMCHERRGTGDSEGASIEVKEAFSMSESIAVANVDDATAKWLGEEAERRGISTESLIAEVIRKGIQAEREGSKLPAFEDLTELAGSWDDKQEAEFL